MCWYFFIFHFAAAFVITPPWIRRRKKGKKNITESSALTSAPSQYISIGNDWKHVRWMGHSGGNLKARSSFIILYVSSPIDRRNMNTSKIPLFIFFGFFFYSFVWFVGSSIRGWREKWWENNESFNWIFILLSQQIKDFPSLYRRENKLKGIKRCGNPFQFKSMKSRNEMERTRRRQNCQDHLNPFVRAPTM